MALIFSKGVALGDDTGEIQMPSTMESFITAGPPALESAQEAIRYATQEGAAGIDSGGRALIYDPAQVNLHSPLTTPNSLRDFIAFEDHARAGAARRGEELNPVWSERPIYYKGNHRAIAGPDVAVSIPAFTEALDFELEVACIIGRSIIDADEDEAAEAIFGFAIMNDWSARDIQKEEMSARLGPAKSKDFATSLGPFIVTADELGPHPKLAMRASVNGEVVCEANLGDARWTFPQMISYVSQGETVWPTDIYGSGTPFGGCLLDHDGPYLKAGDVVELQVEGLGSLRNQVILG